MWICTGVVIWALASIRALASIPVLPESKAHDDDNGIITHPFTPSRTYEDAIEELQRLAPDISKSSPTLPLAACDALVRFVLFNGLSLMEYERYQCPGGTRDLAKLLEVELTRQLPTLREFPDDIFMKLGALLKYSDLARQVSGAGMDLGWESSLKWLVDNYGGNNNNQIIGIDDFHWSVSLTTLDSKRTKSMSSLVSTLQQNYRLATLFLSVVNARYLEDMSTRFGVGMLNSENELFKLVGSKENSHLKNSMEESYKKLLDSFAKPDMAAAFTHFIEFMVYGGLHIVEQARDLTSAVSSTVLNAAMTNGTVVYLKDVDSYMEESHQRYSDLENSWLEVWKAIDEAELKSKELDRTFDNLQQTANLVDRSSAVELQDQTFCSELGDMFIELLSVTPRNNPDFMSCSSYVQSVSDNLFGTLINITVISESYILSDLARKSVEVIEDAQKQLQNSKALDKMLAVYNNIDTELSDVVLVKSESALDDIQNKLGDSRLNNMFILQLLSYEAPLLSSAERSAYLADELKSAVDLGLKDIFTTEKYQEYAVTHYWRAQNMAKISDGYSDALTTQLMVMYDVYYKYRGLAEKLVSDVLSSCINYKMIEDAKMAREALDKQKHSVFDSEWDAFTGVLNHNYKKL